MNVRTILTCLLSFCLLFSMNRVALAAVDPYQFDLLWPQSWFVTGPGGAATDSAGNLYVADTGTHSIMKISRGGALIFRLGTYGTSGNGVFSSPKGVAVDSSGNIYVADSGNNRIQKFDASGNFLTTWGTTGSGDGQFILPYGVAVDGVGNVYVVEQGGGSANPANNRIQKFSSEGVYVTQWGGRGTGDGQFRSPSGVAVDTAGNVYVADFFNNRIQKFNKDGGLMTQWPSSGPTAVTVDSSNNVYVTGTTNQVNKYSSTGSSIGSPWGSAGTGDGQFTSPQGVAADGLGNVYVTDSSNSGRVQKFTASGTFVAVMGSLGNGIPFTPCGVAVNGTGTHIYVADCSINNRILDYAPDGTYLKDLGVNILPGYFLTSVAVDGSGNVYVTDNDNNLGDGHLQKIPPVGSPSYLVGSFSFPYGVAVDTTGNVYVANSGNSNILKFDSAGQVTDIFVDSAPFDVAVDTSGNIYVADTFNDKILKFLADGTPVDAWNTAVNAPVQFSGPEGVSVDSNGNVYVADTGNDRIKKFSADGTLLATWGTPGTAAGKFSSPVDMAVDTFGNVYVADFGNDLIQKFYPSPRMDITVGGTGSGTVTSSPAGISCTSPQTCTSLFFPGALVTLTAAPTSGTLQSWGGNCSTCTGLTCQVTMSSSKTCSASFGLGSSKPGDCNGNGIVSITEVQSAILMNLQLKTVAPCVDTSGNGSVSITEVQRVINANLGL